MDRPDYYAVIPASIRYDERLTPNAKLLYGEITALCNKEGYCWASNDYFAKLYGVSPRTITNWITALKKYGYISISMKFAEDSNRIEQRQIRLVDGMEDNFHIEENFQGVWKKSSIRYRKNLPYGIEENFQDNNTVNITDNITDNSSIDGQPDSDRSGPSQVGAPTNLNGGKENQPSADPSGVVKDSKESSETDNYIKATGRRRPRLGAHYGHAKFTDEEFAQLKKEFPDTYMDWIRKVDEYCEMKGKTYQNYLVVIRRWASNDKESQGKIDMTQKRNATEPYDSYEKFIRQGGLGK